MAQTMETPEDLTQRLPVDLLADVLRRLQTTSPRSLAVSRCVCKAWRDVVDTRRLLVDLLPRSLSGIFVHIGNDSRAHGRELLTQYLSPAMVAMPSANSIAAASFDYADAECSTIKQHCNGLLLLDNEWPRRRGPIQHKAWVLNHGTRRWTRLPPPPPMCTPGIEMEDLFIDDESLMRCHDQHLAFDPAVSPHYQVFLVKHVPFIPSPDNRHYMDDHVRDREWPPSTFVLLVFSSRTQRWEERPFIRQGDAAGTIGRMLEIPTSSNYYGAYCRGTLYVHQHNFILRINMSNDTYQVIKMPKGFRERYIGEHYLGKSENGVYCALLSGQDHGLGLRIWHLDDTRTCDEINWRLKCDINLGPLLADLSCQQQHDDSTIRSEHKICYNRCTLLGFHPNEEIVLLHTPLNRVMSYRFDSSKTEDLGCLPMEPRDSIYFSFPYTSCAMGEFLSKD